MKNCKLQTKSYKTFGPGVSLSTLCIFFTDAAIKNKLGCLPLPDFSSFVSEVKSEEAPGAYIIS
jgi:hypothetical protein